MSRPYHPKSPGTGSRVLSRRRCQKQDRKQAEQLALIEDVKQLRLQLEHLGESVQRSFAACQQGFSVLRREATLSTHR